MKMLVSLLAVTMVLSTTFPPTVSSYRTTSVQDVGVHRSLMKTQATPMKDECQDALELVIILSITNAATLIIIILAICYRTVARTIRTLFNKMWKKPRDKKVVMKMDDVTVLDMYDVTVSETDDVTVVDMYDEAVSETDDVTVVDMYDLTVTDTDEYGYTDTPLHGYTDEYEMDEVIPNFEYQRFTNEEDDFF